MNIWQNFRTRFFRKRILVFCFLNAESHPGRLYRDTRNTLVNLSQCSQSRPRNNCYRGVFNAFRESRNAIIYRTPVKTDEICRAESPGEPERARSRSLFSTADDQREINSRDRQDFAVETSLFRGSRATQTLVKQPDPCLRPRFFRCPIITPATYVCRGSPKQTSFFLRNCPATRYQWTF